MEEYKTCTVCKQTQALHNFSKHNGKKSSKSGYRASCKSCQVKANQIYRAKNREKVNATKRDWAAKNKDKKAEQDKRYREANKSKISKRVKTWRLENLETVKEKNKAWRLQNKEAIAAKDKAYAKAHPEIINRTSQNRRARKRAAKTFQVSAVEMRRLLLRPCLYCGGKSEHLDHIIPLARGGDHSIGNLTGACKTCNLSKGAKFLMEWKRDKGTT